MSFAETPLDCRADADIIPDAPIYIGMDYNANINWIVAGRRKLMPFLNRQNNEDLILALQTAGVSRGRNGFRKDKGGEKLAETEEDLLQHRTDGTDAFCISVALQCSQSKRRRVAQAHRQVYVFALALALLFDTLYMGCSKFPQQTTSTIAFSGVS